MAKALSSNRDLGGIDGQQESQFWLRISLSYAPGAFSSPSRTKLHAAAHRALTGFQKFADSGRVPLSRQEPGQESPTHPTHEVPHGGKAMTDDE